MREPAPDFVIAGAPKCGTTAIYKTLRRHPDLFLPAIKEPSYFAFEDGHRRAVETRHGYERLFLDAAESQLRGEASVMYLSSIEAIPALLSHRPDVKIIAAVRNPIDLFISWHNQCLKHLDEDVVDPECAWRLQEQRAQGKSIAKSRHGLRALQYRQICSLGTQLERLFELVPEHQRLLFVLDDLRDQPREVYQQIVKFLGIRDDGTQDFRRENEFGKPRSQMVARLARLVQTCRPLKPVRLRVKPLLNRRGIYWVERLFETNVEPAERPILSPAFESELLAEFTPQIVMIEKLHKRDFSEWLQRSEDRRRSGAARRARG